MQCPTYTGFVHIDFNLDQLGFTVGTPLGLLICAAVIARILVVNNKISRNRIPKRLIQLTAGLGGFAFITFIKWFFQTWGAFGKWIEYC